MAESLPVFRPGQSITLKASATITGGQMVAVSGSGTVAPAGADSAAWVGQAAFDAATNDNVTIHCGGVLEFVASGAITAGDVLETGAAGKVILGASVTPGTYVGIALTSAADTAKVRVLMSR